MIKPLPGYVLIETIEDDVKTDGGLYVPETEKDKPSKGRVVACGRGTPTGKYESIAYQDRLEPIVLECPVSAGNVVCYKKWTNQEIQHEGKKYLLVSFSELLAIIE